MSFVCLRPSSSECTRRDLSEEKAVFSSDINFLDLGNQMRQLLAVKV